MTPQGAPPSGLDLLPFPFDDGRRDWRMGRGPGALLAAGLPARIAAMGWDTRLVPLDDPAPGDPRPQATFPRLAVLAGSVAAARSGGRLPVILTGQCMAACAAVAGALPPRPSGYGGGVLWLDAHGDLNTPDTSPSGFLDGMAAAAVLGLCHADPLRAVPGFRPVPSEAITFVGVRDLDPGERLRIGRLGLDLLSTGSVGSKVPGSGPLYVHLDLDALDPDAVGPANALAVPGGLTLPDAEGVLRAAGRGEVACVTLSAYDPGTDPDGRIPTVVPSLLGALLGLRTARLRARPAGPEDTDALHAHWTDADVRRHLWDDVVISRDRAAGTVRAMTGPGTGGRGLWLLERGEEPGRPLGFAGLRAVPELARGDVPGVEALVGLEPGAWGRGYAREALEALFRHAFHGLGLPRLYGGADPDNAASIRLMRAAGMRPFGDVVLPGLQGPVTAEYYVRDHPSPGGG